MSLEKIFNVKSGANAPEDFYALQTAALSAWTLLYTLLPSNRAFNRLVTLVNLQARFFYSSDSKVGSVYQGFERRLFALI